MFTRILLPKINNEVDRDVLAFCPIEFLLLSDPMEGHLDQEVVILTELSDAFGMKLLPKCKDLAVQACFLV